MTDHTATQKCPLYDRMDARGRALLEQLTKRQGPAPARAGDRGGNNQAVVLFCSPLPEGKGIKSAGYQAEPEYLMIRTHMYDRCEINSLDKQP